MLQDAQRKRLMSPPHEQMIPEGLLNSGSPEEHFLEGLKSTTTGRSMLGELATVASKVNVDGYFNLSEEGIQLSSSAMEVQALVDHAMHK